MFPGSGAFPSSGPSSWSTAGIRRTSICESLPTKLIFVAMSSFQLVEVIVHAAAGTQDQVLEAMKRKEKSDGRRKKK